MLGFAEFDLLRPNTLIEATTALARGNARPIAGGTDLVPNLRHGLGAPAVLVDLSCIPPMQTVSITRQGAVLGATVTLAKLASHPAIAGAFPALAQAAATVAAPAHRNVATLGGNLCQDTRCVFYNQSAWWRSANDHCLKRGGTLCHVAPRGARCHAAFCSDLAPALLVLDASVSIAGPTGMRKSALQDLYCDDGAAHLDLDAGEVLVTVDIPTQPDGVRSGYRKARMRGAIDFPMAGVAARLTLDGSRISQLRVAITGTDSRPFLLDDLDALRGEVVDDRLLARVGKLVQKQVGPLRTTATPANYRRQVAAALTRRLLRDLAA